MTKINIKQTLKQLLYGLSVIALVVVYFPHAASAAAITARKVVLGSSVPSASTTYNFTFTVPSATTIKSVEFKACTLASTTCTKPTGFSEASSTLSSSSNLGSGGAWTVNTATAGSLRMANASNTGSPSAGITANFSSVVNPSALNSTFFIWITTFSDAAWTTAVDSGVVASSTAGQITVNASVDETLAFTLAAATVNLGVITTSTTGKGTSTMDISTNAASGYSISYTGNTLTSAGGTIGAITTGGGAGSVVNTTGGQFGLNLVSNTTPSVGTNVSGSGSGVAAVNYNTTNLFKFVSGNTVATAAAPTNSNTFTVSYIANVDGATAAGAYTTALTYVATANF
jgi:hypothetical protein